MSAGAQVNSVIANVTKESNSVDDLTPCSACFCNISSLYLAWPGCFGMAGNNTCLCFRAEYKCCKIADVKSTDINAGGELCICAENRAVIIKPTTCCKGVSQCCCLDSRCAFPCDDEVPSILNYLGLTCMYNYKVAFKCCATIRDLKAATA